MIISENISRKRVTSIIPGLILFSLVLANLKPVFATGQPEAPESDNGSGKILPLPIVITEPAIGEGLGAALVYFHGERKTRGLKATTGRSIGTAHKESKPPPTATGIFGAYTNNDTAAVGLGHSNSFQDDRYRLAVAVAEARINSSIYLADIEFDPR